MSKETAVADLMTDQALGYIGDHKAGLPREEADPGLEKAQGQRAVVDPADVSRVDLGRDQRQ